jgi:hypothetical protein
VGGWEVNGRYPLAMRPFADLRSDQPAWPAVLTWVAESPHPVEVLPPDADRAERCLVAVQVTDGSVLGAVILNTGGVLVDHGWLRLLGSGGGNLPGVDEANRLSGSAPPTGPMLIGHDVIGGRFSINDGSLPGEPGEIVYWAPDSLRSEPLGLGHSSFVQMVMTDALGAFYGQTRWPGWERDVEQVGGDQAISLYPPPFSVEGKDLESVSKAIVPLEELVYFYEEAARQLGASGD